MTYGAYRKRIRRNNSNYNNRSNDGMLLTDFKFYNKQKHLISKEKIAEFEKLLSEDINKNIFWTSEELLKMKIGFKFYTYIGHDRDNKIVNEQSVNIIQLKNFVNTTPEEFSKCKTIFNRQFCLLFKPTDIQQEFLVDWEENLLSDCNVPAFNSFDEVLEFLITNQVLCILFDGNDVTKNNMKKIFNIDVKIPEYNIVSNRGGFGSVVPRHIIAVIEKRYNNKNYRITLSTVIQTYSNREFELDVYSEDSKYYNMIDEDRLFFVNKIIHNSIEVTDRYFLDNGLIQRDKRGIVLISLDLFGLLSRNLNTILNSQQFIITSQIYRFYAERIGNIIDYNFKNNNDIDEKEILIIEKYKKVLKENRQIKLDNLVISRNNLQVVGQQFNMKFNRKFLDVIENFHNIKNIINKEDVKYNFNTLYEQLLLMSELKIITRDNVTIDDYKNFVGSTFIINDMKIVIKKENNRVTINGIFCRIDDIFQLLNRAVCYNDIKEYNKYIKDVSYIGHEWKRIIGTGVQIELQNPFSNIFTQLGYREKGNTMMRFSFLWDDKKRTHIYLLINNEKYLIKNKLKFKNKFNVPKLVLNMRQLKDILTNTIEGLTDDMIIEIVEHAMEEGKIIQKKAIALVEATVSDIGAVKQEMIINNGKRVGYVFNSINGNEYFVDANDLSVYKKMDGQWNRRCVVNDTSKNRIFEDWLANRLVNVFNEPAYIKTLQA